MTERHYGNDVPTGPIPVIPPQSDTETPVPRRPPTIPAQRSESASTPDTEHATPRRRRWLWPLLVLLIALCVLAAVLVAQGGFALFLG